MMTEQDKGVRVHIDRPCVPNSPKGRRDTPARISVIVCCYNEEEGIQSTIEALVSALRDDDLHAYEFVFVDDHSADSTPEILCQAAAEHPNVKVIRLGANMGSHVAGRAGLAHCCGDAAVFLAADLQEGPELVSQLLAKWRDGADVVCSLALSRHRGGLAAHVFARVFYFLVRRLGNVKNVHAFPRLIDRKVIDRYCRFAPRNHNRAMWILLQRFHTAYVESTTKPREHGKSKWTFGKKLRLAKDTLLDITPTFLVGWSLLGAGLLGLGLLQGVAALLYWVWPRWGRSLTGVGGSDLIVTLVLVVGGIVLLGLGAVGCYIWRIYQDLRIGPEWNVQWTVNASAGDRSRGPDVRADEHRNELE